MSFHDVRFSTVISRGSAGGPGFYVDIIQTDSGSDERVSRWPLPKRRYNASHGIRSIEDLYDTIEFFIARDGPTNGFRWKDWIDYTTGLRGTGAPSNTDETIGTGDGTTTKFQLIKTYEPGIYSKIRPLEKPVSGTVVVALDAVDTTAFTVDTSTGEVTMNTAPASGVNITAGCEFDVPVQFGPEFSIAALQASLDNFAVGSIADIPLVEMNGNTSAPERFYHGKGAALALTADSNFQWDWGSAVILVPSVAVKVFLPNPADLESGINYPYFFNAAGSALNITFRDHTDSTTLFTLAQNKGGFSFVYDDLASTRRWGIIAG